MLQTTKQTAVPCLLQSWHLSESEIYHWLVKQSGDPQLSFDLLQDTFLRALQQQKRFCDIQNQRAWLFRVAHNLLLDALRLQPKSVDIDSYHQLESPKSEGRAAVESLAQCLPKALTKLSSAEQDIIRQCDLQGLSQQAFADAHQLSLSATKSRIQRARKKLKQILQQQCQIRFDEQQRVCCFITSDT